MWHTKQQSERADPGRTRRDLVSAGRAREVSAVDGRNGPAGNGPLRTRRRVLVIDDDDAVCEVLREALSEDGYAVATVPHGAAALELVKHHQPEVILLDLRMPIMDGWSFAEQYRRAAKPAASLILLSALKDVEQSAKRLGAVAFIQKPFEIDEVVQLIERCISAS
jgi:CheY-like chemotaxis protein